ncbi:hypothetical protein G6L97_27050 (plasmid) [Agrobacterium tumefaciens]|uniref:hypothetical protein n=1 Tax=Agrobacterium tumefaciens TaxID=358 RepID=UPI001574599C|nr:hypothetical protein [Agrobacterium tumefaciens]WCA73024.1 hypothetical protein G6L97_27050 [Agrobacterium tumefaciens]
MINAEVIKEFLRDAYNEGALDLGVDRKFLEGFIRIFAGEQEAIQAIAFASYLDDDEQAALFPLAKITPESASHYHAWLRRIEKSN